jgi:hypothetical protein
MWFFHRARPAGEPLRRVAAALVGDDERVVKTVATHYERERVPAPRVFRVGESGIRRLGHAAIL